MNHPPVFVEILRGGRVECRHRISAIVVDAENSEVFSAGDAGARVYPRSSVKPFQALPVIETGTADRFSISDAELALACASHRGEPMHVELALGLLKRIGLRAEDLACGAHPPTDNAAARNLICQQHECGREHNNCSGKHAAMLATAVHMNETVIGYHHPGHPVQKRTVEAIELLSGDVLSGPPGIDGCSLPTYALSLKGLALAAARLAAPEAIAAKYRPAAERVVHAMRAHPVCVGGTNAEDSRMMAAIPDLVVKTGAEGVYMASLLGRGLGVALKVEDGAGRASVVALLAILGRLGVLDADAREALSDMIQPEIRSYAGEVAGEIRVSHDWQEALLG